MTMHWMLLAFMVLIKPDAAEALCTYHGIDNAEPSFSREYHDSLWVVRAHVMSADYHWSDEDESWVVYHLKTVENFKGKLRPRFTFYTERNSGGFYMDGKDATPDLDGDYLLFLVPRPHRQTDPIAANRALWVNYNCGKSKPWDQVTAAEIMQLRMSGHAPSRLPGKIDRHHVGL